MNTYVGTIMLFGGNFAPEGWAFCDGQLLPISEYEILFNLLGTTYGGDGENTFALPDLRGRSIVGIGQGPGLPTRWLLGEQLGSEATLKAGTGPKVQPYLTCNYVISLQGIYPMPA